MGGYAQQRLCLNKSFSFANRNLKRSNLERRLETLVAVTLALLKLKPKMSLSFTYRKRSTASNILMTDNDATQQGVIQSTQAP